MQAFATALEQASQRAFAPTARLSSAPPPELANLGDASPSPQAQDLATPPSQAAGETPLPGQLVAPTAAATPALAVVPPPLKPTITIRQRIRHLPGVSAAILIGLVVIVIAGGILGSFSLLAHFGVLGAHSGPPAIQVVRGGTWTYGLGGSYRFAHSQ